MNFNHFQKNLQTKPNHPLHSPLPFVLSFPFFPFFFLIPTLIHLLPS
ncbi:YqzM family protein [Bacillus subtilis]